MPFALLALELDCKNSYHSKAYEKYRFPKVMSH